MVLLQLKDTLEVFAKIIEFLPCSRFSIKSQYDLSC